MYTRFLSRNPENFRRFLNTELVCLTAAFINLSYPIEFTCASL